MTVYHLDPAHSEAIFIARHMMFTKVRGSFQISASTLNFDPANPAASSVEVTLDTNSVATGDEKRDAHLRSADFFDAEAYPTLSFKSTKVETADGKTGKVYGDLTMHGQTHPIIIDAEYLGEIKDPWGNNRVAFSGTAKINREDWGLGWNVALEAGGVLVSKEIELALDVQAIPVTEPVAG